MSPLTKVLTVVVMVLSCVLVALVVPFVAKTDNYKDQLQEARTSEKSAKAEANAKASLVAQAVEELNSYKATENAAFNTLSQQFASLQVSERDARLAATQAQLSLKAATDRLDELNSNVNKATEVAATTIESADSLSRDLAESQRKQRDLEAALESAQAAAEQALSQARYYQEQLIKLQATAAGSGSEAGATLASIVEGEVTEVISNNGEVFLEINLGAADGLVSGAELIVSRDELVGLLTITEVRPNQAVGRVRNMSLMPATGDRVFNG